MSIEFDPILRTKDWLKSQFSASSLPWWPYIPVANATNAVVDPVNPQDAATKNYVDTIVQSWVRLRGTFTIDVWLTAEYPKALASGAVNAVQTGNGSWAWPIIKAWDTWVVQNSWLVWPNSESVDEKDWIVALVDNATNLDADWLIIEGNSPIVEITRANALALISWNAVKVWQLYKITDRRNVVIIWQSINSFTTTTAFEVLANEFANTVDELVACQYDIVNDNFSDLVDLRNNNYNYTISFANLSLNLTYHRYWEPTFGKNYFEVLCDLNSALLVTGLRAYEWSNIFCFTNSTIINTSVYGVLQVENDSTVNTAEVVTSASAIIRNNSTIRNIIFNYNNVNLWNYTCDFASISDALFSWNITVNWTSITSARLEWIWNTSAISISWIFIWQNTNIAISGNSILSWNGINVNATIVNSSCGWVDWKWSLTPWTFTGCNLNRSMINREGSLNFNAITQEWIRLEPWFSNIEKTIDVTWSTTINLQASNESYVWVLNLQSSNTINTLNYLIRDNKENHPITIKTDEANKQFNLVPVKSSGVYADNTFQFSGGSITISKDQNIIVYTDNVWPSTNKLLNIMHDTNLVTVFEDFNRDNTTWSIRNWVKNIGTGWSITAIAPTLGTGISGLIRLTWSTTWGGVIWATNITWIRVGWTAIATKPFLISWNWEKRIEAKVRHTASVANSNFRMWWLGDPFPNDWLFLAMDTSAFAGFPANRLTLVSISWGAISGYDTGFDIALWQYYKLGIYFDWVNTAKVYVDWNLILTQTITPATLPCTPNISLWKRVTSWGNDVWDVDYIQYQYETNKPLYYMN